MHKKTTKLYNMIFPLWLLWLIPATWILVLPANLLIDFLVLILTMKYLHIPDAAAHTKSVILKTWIMGFAADFIGTLAMSVSTLISFDSYPVLREWWYSNITYGVGYDPFHSIYAFLFTTVCVFVTACFIYIFNYKWCLKKTALTEEEKKKIARSLAIFTAPYLFYLPTSWFVH